MTTEYIRCADVAKLIRAALRHHFPGVTFSVNSKTYSGGASINVAWTDGPTAKMVDAVCGPFAGSRFDGMQDLKIPHSSWLKDGAVVEAGTAGARPVRFCADFIFTNRRLSPSFEARVLTMLRRRGHDIPADAETFDQVRNVRVSDRAWCHDTLADLARTLAARTISVRADARGAA